MDPREPRRRSFDRPNTLGETWRNMNQPPGRKVGDLPPLPKWPPLPGEQLTGEWPPLGPELTEPGEPGGADTSQPTGASETTPPWRPPEAPQPETGILQRWRRASTRVRLGIVAGLILSVLLIVSCSSLALGAASGLVGSGATLPSNALATRQPTGLSATPSNMPAATPAATHAAAGAATSTATSAASQPLTLTFTCASGSLHGTGQVCVHTEPSSALTISVRYCDGTIAKGLHGAAVADGNGAYTWSWPVRAACVGTATATVTARWNGQSLTATKSFSITA